MENLRKNLKVAEKMMNKHRPEYDRILASWSPAYGDMPHTKYEDYRRVYNRLEKCLCTAFVFALFS